MRRILIWLVFSVLLNCTGSPSSLSSPTNEVLEPPDLSFQIEGAPTGIAYLIGINGGQNYRLDSTQINSSGQIHFQREEPYPSGLLYLLLPDQSYLQFIVDKDQTFSMKTRVGALIAAMEVTGSTDNELLYKTLVLESQLRPRFQAVARQLSAVVKDSPQYLQAKAQQDKLVAERNAYLNDIFSRHPTTFFTKFKKAGQNPPVQDVRKPDGSLDEQRQVYLYRNAFWDNVDFSEEGLLRTPVIANKLSRYMKELTVQQPDSIKKSAAFLIEKVLEYPEYYQFFANWIALQYEPAKTSLMDSEAVYVFMVQNYFTYDRAFWSDSSEIYALQLRAHEMSASLIGQKGPDVKAKDPNGRLRSISEMTEPYVVVYLYNPDCDHCIEETPKLVNLYRQRKDGELGVFAIAVDTDEQEWKNFIRRNRMDWVNVFDPTNRAIYATYYVDNTPEIYVLNPQRTIIGKNLKVHQIEEVIQRDRARNQ